jgi:carbamoylphosphate synthase small subunit
MVLVEPLSKAKIAEQPEASPGPHDSDYLFPRFVGLMEKVRK